MLTSHWPLTRYLKLLVALAPGMSGTFSPPSRVSDPYMHHDSCVKHVPWCMPGSVTSSFLWSRWRGKRSRHSQRMRNPQFYASGETPILVRFWGIQLIVSSQRVPKLLFWMMRLKPCCMITVISSRTNELKHHVIAELPNVLYKA